MSNQILSTNSTRFQLDRVFGSPCGSARAEAVVERLLETGFWCPRAVKTQGLVCLQDWLVAHGTHSNPQP